MREDHSVQRERRPILGARDDGVERLIAGLPSEIVDDVNGLRNWTKAMTRSINTWQVERGQERSRNRLARGR